MVKLFLSRPTTTHFLQSMGCDAWVDFEKMELLKNFSPPPGYKLPTITPRWPASYDASGKERYVETVVNQRSWTVDETGDLRLMSYNILADSCLEDPQFLHASTNELHINRRTDFILAEIAALSPDVLTL